MESSIWDIMIEKVSVITIVKDHEKGLVATLESLLAQKNINWESVIVVSESVDKTQNIANCFKEQNRNVIVVNQISKGIYQAMNEGIYASTGKYLVFMNAGDVFSNPESLSGMCNEIQNHKCGVIVGGYRVLGKDKIFSYSEKKLSSLRFAFNLKSGCHQAMIFSRVSVLKFRGYDSSFKLCADYRLVLQILSMDGGRRVNTVFAAVEPGGISDRSLTYVHSEKHDIRKEILGKLIWLPSLIWKILILAKIKTKRSRIKF
jgi:glycosyltransferase involved in cell wall biosynthesis